MKISAVFYHGRKYGYEKNELLSSADLFVFPTYYYNECLPLVIIEAMQKHIAVISTTEGGISDLIDDTKTGLQVKKNNALDLAEKMQMILENPELCRKMGESGFIKYKKEFTLGRFEQNFLDCLRKCLS